MSTHATTTPMTPTALIAEDEPLLAANLQAELAAQWPALRVLANVAHGQAALDQALALRPDVLFLDISMPGMSGLDAAFALADAWPGDGPLPLIVFVTAYDQYALQAFERAAIDYVLKPVLPERLAQTCARLQAALRLRAAAVSQRSAGAPVDMVIDQLRGLLDAAIALAPTTPSNQSPTRAAPLRVLQVGVGNTITMVPLDTVLYLEAADKYVRVVTATREHLLRIALRELQPQLDPAQFWQVHRGTIVRYEAIASAVRADNGKLTLTLRQHADRLSVSRLYAHLFAAM
jgi:DNA-binding LytR/AlgR family response regulator